MLLLLLAFSTSAAADTYTVTRTDDPFPDACLPADCSLREAIEASNASTAIDDRVLVQASTIPYTLTFKTEFQVKPLEPTDSVEVLGAGADRVTITRNGGGSVLQIPSVTPSPVVLLEGLTVTGGSRGIQNNGDLTLRRVSVERNPGGGIHTNGPLTVDSSFIGFNEDFSSAGIFASAPTTVVNSTIAWNTAGSISGIGGNTSITIISSAVVFNHSNGDTEAGVAAVSLTVRDSVFAGNTNAKGLLNCASFPTLNSLGGNVADDATCGTAAGDKPNTNSRVDTLGLYGGTTPVYNLDPASPAIDAATQCLPFDQRGLARPQGVACDSGPYELVPASTPAPVDREFSMRVGKTLRLGKNAIWVKLTCPKGEASPPCRGKATVFDPPLVFEGDGLRTMQVRSLSAKFTIQPGRTKAVPLRRPRSVVKRLSKGRGPWRVILAVRAEDAAGNRWDLKKKRALLIRR